MMKILLINPSHYYYRRSLRASAQGSIGLPLHILYIAAALEEKGHEVKIIDSLVSEWTKTGKTKDGVTYGISDDILFGIIKGFRPDIVGITNEFTTQEESAFKTAKLVKGVGKSILVIAGGANVNCRGRHLLEVCNNIDIVVKSEGEETICELLDSYERKGALERIKGIMYRKGSEITETEPRPFISDIDSISLPAYHLIDMEAYLTLYKKGIYVRDRDVKRNVSIVTSRGCPYRCIFCSVSQSMGRKWRPHSANYVIKHIEKLWKEYKIEHIHFEDDNLLFDPRRFIPIMETLSKKGITWDTPNGIRVDLSLSEEMLKRMKLSGCKSLTIGVESGDEQILNNVIRKNIRLTDVKEFARRCKRVKLPLRAFFMLGLPGETKETMQRTIDFALTLLNKYDVEVINFMATPLYGSELYNMCEKNNYFSKEINPKSLSESTQPDGYCLIDTKSVSHKDVERMSRQFTAKIYRIMLKKALKNPAHSVRRVGNLYMFNKILKRIISIK